MFSRFEQLVALAWKLVSSKKEIFASHTKPVHYPDSITLNESAHGLLITLAIESAVAVAYCGSSNGLLVTSRKQNARTVFPQEQIELLIALVEGKKARSLPKVLSVNVMMLELAPLEDTSRIMGYLDSSF